MSSFKDFLRWYNNKDNVPTLDAMQKKMAFYHDNYIDMLKLGFTLPNLANNCLHKSTDANSIHSRKEIMTFWQEFDKMSLVVHLAFLLAKQLLMKLLFESLQTYANLLLGLMPANYIPTRCVNPCLPVFIRVGTSIQKRVDSHLDKTRPAALKIWSYPISNEQDQNVKLKASLQQTDRRNLTASVLMSFALIATLCLKPWVAFTTSVPVKSCVPLSLKKIFNVVARRELNALRRHYIQEKGFKVIEMWDGEWWILYKTTNTVKQHIPEHFPYRRSLQTEQLLEKIKEGKLFGYVQRGIEVPENLRSKFDNFPPIFKNTLVSKSDIGDLMKNYAEEERVMSQPRKKLISSFTLQNATLITPSMLFYPQLGLICRKIHCFVEYTPKKIFNSFVQSAGDARRQVDENPNSSVVAETMKLLANSSYGYQIMDRSRHTVTKYLTKKHMRPLIVNSSKSWIM